MTARGCTLTLVTLLLLAAPRVVRADDFAAFRVPDNRVLLWTGSSNGWAGWRSVDEPYFRTENGSFRGSLASTVYYRSESDSRTRQWRASAEASGSRSHDTRLDLPPEPSLRRAAEQTTRSVSGRIALYVDEEWFPRAWPFSLTAGLGATQDQLRGWNTSRIQESYAPLSSGMDDISESLDVWQGTSTANGTVGVGVGRVRNATGLYEARVFENRLLAAGALARPLGEVARGELAALFYARTDYAWSLESPAPAVWGAIEEILRRDGALKGAGLDARTAFGAAVPYMSGRRAAGVDGLPVSPILRQSGATVHAVLMGSTGRLLTRQTGNESHTYSAGGPVYNAGYSWRWSDGTDAAWAGVVAEYHRPAGLRWQFDGMFSTLVNLRPEQRAVQEAAAASATFILADRWLASANLAHSRTVNEDPPGTTLADSWFFRGGASCEYWVSDHVDLNLQFEQTWSKRLSPYLEPPTVLAERHEQFGRLSFGLGYRFAGFTEIPGISGMLR
jgi:hypothetical protein